MLPNELYLEPEERLVDCDYTYFNNLKGCIKYTSDSIENNPNKNKVLYMTYDGLIKLVYSSRSKCAARFQQF